MSRCGPTPAVAQGITDRVWSIGDLLDAALATLPIDPVVAAPDRRRAFRLIEGGKEYRGLELSGLVTSMALDRLKNGRADHLAEPASRHRVEQFGYFALLHQARQAFGVTRASRLVG
jgi:hypothetical protein